MTDHADAARRRELQRRAFAVEGSLTPEEEEELRMLSAPAPAPAPAPASLPEPPAVAPTPGMTDAAGSDAVEQAPASEPEPDPATEFGAAPARRPRRALAVVITVAALVLGAGIGWLSSPRTLDAAPTMTVEQQTIDAEIVASGDFDAGSVQFRGEKDGAALWSATQKEKPCVVLSVDGQRSTGCVSGERSDGGIDYPVAQVQTQDGDTSANVTGLLIPTLSGDWAPVIEHMALTAGDWQGQYSSAELALIDILEKAGLHGSELQILGYDGDIPVWSTWGPERCIAVVDPATSAVQQHCTDDYSEGPLEIALGDSVYQAVWSDQRGPVLTILKQATALQVTCDIETGDCTWVDDTPVDVG
ncbi:hypothetical protein QF046_001341 [Microbacterium sp. W4I4]|uniref:hypothetical protein n=1 Tax=Microbacterium sp. W4I4 TaxID=3042295 RepID=UPI002787E51E|nr:hypothetical protein [Microbacterium sp. W4I4]MDQ0613700.1 hypothetical protein [Microbacterium sp. W4I4]